MMRRNDIEGSGDVGVQNSDPTMILDARSNWWGDLSGPSGEGPGSGDAVSRYVDFADWRIMPFDVVVTAAIDTLWVRPGDTDSLAVYFRDGLRSDGVLAIDASDDRGWVVGTGRAEVDLVDSLGGETTYAYTIPQDVGAGTFDYFRFTATSTEDDAQTDSDSLVIATYAPVLTRLIIGPDTLKVLPGDTADFVAIGFDQHGRLVETGATIWNATGGIIDNEGLFIAGGAHGTYLVTGRDDASGVEGATVVIVTDDISSVAAPVAGDAPIDLSVVATPNPVRERTTIRFTVDDLDIDGTQHTPVSLRIVDPLGRVVATLVDHTLTSGSYSVAWEVGEALPSGLYHVDLQTGDRRAAGSLILTR